MTETVLFRTARQSLGRIRSLPALNPLTMMEVYREKAGGHEVLADHGPHLDAALEWGRRLAQATTLPIEVRPFQGEG